MSTAVDPTSMYFASVCSLQSRGVKSSLDLELHRLQLRADQQRGVGRALYILDGKVRRNFIKHKARLRDVQVSHLGDDGIHHAEPGDRQGTAPENLGGAVGGGGVQGAGARPRAASSE